MQLSLHADYGLRVLVYLGTHPGRPVTTQEISRAYGISKNHLVRVVQTLAEHNYVRIQTGRSGGVRLGKDPDRIRIGDVVRDAEPSMRLVECFEKESNTCPIAPVCALKGMLREAQQAFINVLNQYTIADVLRGSGQPALVNVFALFAAGRS